MTTDVGVVLVHGLWHGGWAWDEVRAGLTAAGIPSAVVELPLVDLAGDVAATRRVLDELGLSAVLVGHSYGGAVITEAGEHPAVRELVYLSGFLLDEGESVGRALPDADFPGTYLGEALVFSADGSQVRLPAAAAQALMYADVAGPVAAEAIARLRPVHLDVFGGVPASFAWRRVPSTYVVSADDLAVHPELQRAMARRATRSLEWSGGHSQAALDPGRVVDLLAAVVAQAR
jgi:pimeloyl-ACP methyl ester carboxylesterase